jgi:hypothetical protein
MYHYQNSVTNQNGLPVVAAQVTINAAGTQTPATIYSDNGITVKTNPVTTNALGMFDFYVANGRYDLVVTGSSVTPYTLTDEAIFDSLTQNLNTVAYTATPVFPCNLGNQQITLTGNVTSSTLTGIPAGQQTTFLIIQDATGGHTFTWPTNVKGGVVVDPTANATTSQTFISNGTNLYAIAPGALN